MGESIRAEKWLPIAGHEGAYEVSNLGNVRSLDRVVVRSNGAPQTIRGRVLTRSLMSAGYPVVTLCKVDNGTSRGAKQLIHRLVARAFLGPGEEGQEVCHIDGDRTNPRADNLRWGTRAENMADCLKHGTWRNQNLGITHCKRGHEFTVSNTYEWRGHRTCRACERERHAKKRNI